MLPDIVIIIKVKFCVLCVILIPKAEKLSCFRKPTMSQTVLFIIMVVE